MFKSNSQYIITILFIFYIIVSCKSYSLINYSYQKRDEASKNDLKVEEEYYKRTSDSLVRKNDEVLIVFNGESFKNSIVVLNRTDTLKFIPKKGRNCMGLYLKKVKKKVKKITLFSNKKKSIEFKVKNNYDYIKVNGSFDNKWSIVYSQFFPSIICR